MNETDNTPLLPGPVKRPDMLTILCILTFIGSGLALVSNLMTGAVLTWFYDIYAEVIRMMSEKFNIPGMEQMLEMSPWFYVVAGILAAISLGGALQMFRLKKTGFHLYTVSQIASLLLPMIALRQSLPSLPDAFITAVFIFLYSRNLSYMN